MSNTEIRTLNDNELDLANGGYINCSPPKATIETYQPTVGEFQSTFVTWKIGRYTPVPA